MQKTKNKRYVKIIALAVVTFFALGIVGIAVTQTQIGFAAPAAGNSAIGYVDRQKLVGMHPDTKGAMEALQAENVQLEKEFNEKAKDMQPQEKQRYGMQLQQRLEKKREELLKPIIDKIDAAIKQVAEAKGITVVVDQMVIIYGGTDLTDEVVKAYGGAKKK